MIKTDTKKLSPIITARAIYCIRMLVIAASEELLSER